MAKKTKDVIKGIPVELLHVDEDSGEVCIGDECFMIKVAPETNAITFEYNPESQVCSLKTKRVAKKFMRQIFEEKPKVKFRRVS